MLSELNISDVVRKIENLETFYSIDASSIEDIFRTLEAITDDYKEGVLELSAEDYCFFVEAKEFVEEWLK